MYVSSPHIQLALTTPVQPEKGGDINVVKESQKKRNASVELVDEVMALFNEHKEGELSVKWSGVDKLIVKPTTIPRIYDEKLML